MKNLFYFFYNIGRIATALEDIACTLLNLRLAQRTANFKDHPLEDNSGGSLDFKEDHWTAGTGQATAVDEQGNPIHPAFIPKQEWKKQHPVHPPAHPFPKIGDFDVK